MSRLLRRSADLRLRNHPKPIGKPAPVVSAVAEEHADGEVEFFVDCPTCDDEAPQQRGLLPSAGESFEYLWTRYEALAEQHAEECEPPEEEECECLSRWCLDCVNP